MNTVIFDGRAYAQKKEKELQKKVVTLKEKGITPRMVSFVVGNEKGALQYQKMKTKKGREGLAVSLR